ncbi:MAG: energy-coupling factor ABC transporter ATP-binding protein [Undibacterium sp.]|nr:energy-coupling factor ABC transporter ATP-binding protein [Undibacterium sp.]
MNALISLHGIQKKIGDRVLLDIDFLQVEQACAYVLTGINGAGKTTLLRILSGLDTALIDKANFLGGKLDWFPYPAILRNAIVYVHQHPIMFSGSVANNIAFGLKVHGVSTSEQMHAVQRALEWAGIEHLRERQAITLSGGEKQRVALARAKVLQPKLLLLDEPTSNLDGEAREQVIALIPELIKDGSSVIMVCHDRDLIALPDVQRLKLRDGKLENRQSDFQQTLR